MSIVGTRPPLISETNLYELHHYARLAIKPGITGLWQVSGRSDITDFEEVVRLDKVFYTLAGPEISVATTKAYSAQLAAMYCLAVQFAKVREKITKEQYS